VDVQLFILDRAESNSWLRARTQVDPVDEDGRIEFSKNENWRLGQISPFDRMIIDAESLGRKLKSSDRLPCMGSQVYEIRDAINPEKFGYLTACHQQPPAKQPAFKELGSGKIKYDSGNSAIQTDFYKYIFSNRNHMLFRQIEVGNLKSKEVVGVGSDIMIRADIKNFFKFHFDSTDIESYLEEVRVGDLGANARLSFFLKIFYFFTIKLSLSTDVSFYKSSANIPMVIHIPNDAKARLHPGSGIVYSWEVPTAELSSSRTAKMAEMTTDLAKVIHSGNRRLAVIGKKLCRGSTSCVFRFSSEGHGGDFTMDFTVPRAMVDRGFFPIFVPDISRFNDDLDWKLPVEKEKLRTGFYFETSGLSAGNYPWDFWMRLGGNEQLDFQCPHPIYAHSLDLRSIKK
jgi:hypothetical protein